MSSIGSDRRRLAALAVTVVMLGGLAPLAAPARVAAVALASPTLTSPSPGSTVTGNPLFAWTGVSNAVKYRIEISTSPTFSSPVVAETQNLRFAPPTELPLGTHYWRVAARDAGNVLGIYSVGTFDKEWGAAPSPITPPITDPSDPDGVVDLQFPEKPLLFAWNPLPGAQSYELQVDDADDFIGASVYKTKNTSYVITEPRTVNQTFYWRLRGVSGGNNSNWSPVGTFRSTWFVKAVLVYPANTATNITDVYFDWNPVPGAKSYQLQVSPNRDWANNKTVDVTVKSTRYVPPIPLNNGNYFWRVRALDAASPANFGPWSDEGAPGEERVFQRGWSDKPSLVWPANGTSTSAANLSDATWQNPTFSWTPARHASWYRLRFSTDATMTSGLRGCITNRTTWTPYLTPAAGISLVNPGPCSDGESLNLTPGTTYYWDVAGIDSPVLNQGLDIWGPPDQKANIIGLRSSVRSFVYQPDSTGAGAPRQLVAGDYLTPPRCDPADSCGTVEEDTPVFTWTAIPGATSYTVTVALDPNFTNVYRVYTTQFNRLAPRDSWRDNQANQAYYWNVHPTAMAINITNCPTDHNKCSVFQKHTVPVHLTKPAAPDNVLPNDFALEWQDYLDTNRALTPPIPQEAKQYRIQVSTVKDFATLIETRVGNTPFYTPFDKTYPEGPIYWRVQAIDGSNNDLTVSTSGLVTKKSPPPIQIYPVNGATATGVPYLKWSPLAYAASYDVQIDNDANFSSPVATATTKMTAWAYTEPLATGTFYWRVRRNDADNRDGLWSAVRSFVLKPSAPTLLGPTNGAGPSPTTLLLTWKAGTDPVTKMPLSAPKYQVEVSTSPTFGSFVSGFPQVTVMTSWAPTTLLNNGTYYWRVKALNASGTPVATSSTFNFKIDSTRPSVTKLSPASSAPITSAFTVTFSEPVKGINATNLKVTVAGTSTPVLGTLAILSTTAARFTPASLLVPGQTYIVGLNSTITDLAGNPLFPYSANVRTSTTVQQDSAAVREAWGRWTTSSASGGAMKLARAGSTSLTLKFTGSSISLVGYRGTVGGYAAVYLDGVLQASNLSFYASASQYRRTLWSKAGLANVAHTLQIWPRGTKPTASRGTWVYVDAFLVNGATTIQENGAGVTDRFRRIATANASGLSYDRTSHKAATGRSGPSLSLQFKGTGISWYGTKGTSYGKAYVYIDGSRKATIDLYRSATAYKVRLWTSTTLTNAVHTLKVVVVGSKRTASKGWDVSFDYFVIR